MSVRSAQSITKLFATSRFDTGASTNGDSLPAGTLYVNGVSNAATVTVTPVTTGVYKAQVTLPTLAVGDVVDLRIAVTVNSVSANGVIWSDTKDIVIDSAGLADANAVKLGPSGSGTPQTARDVGASVLVGDKTGFSLATGAIVTATFGTCDFTSTMKTSLNAATPAVTVSDKTGFSLANGSIVTATFGTCDFTSTMKTSITTAASSSTPAVTVSDKTGFSLANGSIVTATFGTCDFTATMKTSLNAATPTVTVSDKTGFSLLAGSIVTATFGTCDFTSTMKTSLSAATPAVTISDKTGFSLASTGLDLVLVATKTLPAAIKYIGAMCSGISSGAGTGTELFYDFAGALAVSIIVDANGNRSGAVYN